MEIVSIPSSNEATGRGLVRSWSPDDLPWAAALPWDSLPIPDRSSLLLRVPGVEGMDADGRAAIKRSELSSHLAALTDGERRAVELADETRALLPQSLVSTRDFLTGLRDDEVKHFAVMQRYLTEQISQSPVEHPALTSVFDALLAERDVALNLLVGQVVLEGTAASLLGSLLVSTREPLLRELLRNVGRDEARHMAFALTYHLSFDQALTEARRRRMEELLFEAAWAATASLVAQSTWVQFGLDPHQARNATVDALKERGVIAYYTQVVMRQLEKRGFPGTHLRAVMEQHLEQRLRALA